MIPQQYREALKMLGLNQGQLDEMCIVMCGKDLEYYKNPQTVEECVANYKAAPVIAAQAELIINAKMKRIRV